MNVAGPTTLGVSNDTNNSAPTRLSLSINLSLYTATATFHYGFLLVIFSTAHKETHNGLLSVMVSNAH